MSRMVANVYDPNQRGNIDWREILFKSFVLSNLELSPREALISAFHFFTDSSSKAKVEAIQDILLYLISPEVLPKFLDKFFERWVVIRLEGPNRRDHRRFGGIDETISFRLFSEIVASIVDESETDESFECRFYPSYLQRIQECRRHIRQCFERVTITTKKTPLSGGRKKAIVDKKYMKCFQELYIDFIDKRIKRVLTYGKDIQCFI